MNIELDFNIGDHIKFKSFGNWVEGYIVGVKYTDHCYLKKPCILYAIIINGYYEDYKESIDKHEPPFAFNLHWRLPKDIIHIK